MAEAGIGRKAQPYIGPRPFSRADSGLFFGRQAEINSLTDRALANLAILVYAPSGAGKSSLIHAGLPPALEAQGWKTLGPTRVATP